MSLQLPLEEQLFDFSWPRPARAGDLVLVQRQLEGCEFTQPVPVLAERYRSLYEPRWYRPLIEEPNLFLRFAETPPTAEGVLQFAGRFGRLGLPVMWRCDPGPVDEVPPVWCPELTSRGNDPLAKEFPHPGICCEPLFAWQAEISWVAHLVRVWEAAQAGTRLGSLVKRKGDSFSVVLPSPAAQIPGELRHRWRWAQRANTYPETYAGGRRGPTALAHILRVHLLLSLNEELKWMTRCAMEWDRARRQPALVVQPNSLLGAIYLQVAQAVDWGGACRTGRCLHCQRRFLLAPGVGRADRSTCSDSCRVGLHKWRVRRAAELRAEGKTLREIAFELGVETKMVKGWLQKKGR